MTILGRLAKSPRQTAVSTPLTVPSLDDPAEVRRQHAVDALDILDTAAEDRYNRIVEMARSLYHTDAAVFSVIDHNREWFKAATGTSSGPVDRSMSFCSVTIQQRESLVVADASADPRFSSNPGVLGGPRIRFYAGVPIRSRDGENIGALCVTDSGPRAGVDMAILEQLALLIQAELRLTSSVAQYS